MSARDDVAEGDADETGVDVARVEQAEDGDECSCAQDERAEELEPDGKPAVDRDRRQVALIVAVEEGWKGGQVRVSRSLRKNCQAENEAHPQS